MSLEPRGVVERYLREVLSGAGPASIEELVDNGVLGDKVRSFRSAFPDLTVTPRQMVTDGDVVAVHASASGTHRKVFQGLPATGRRWSASCTALYRIEDGRIVDFWVTWDLLSIMEQLGGVKRSPGASA